MANIMTLTMVIGRQPEMTLTVSAGIPEIITFSNLGTTAAEVSSYIRK